MPGLTRIEEETLRSYGWRTVDEIRQPRAPEKSPHENWELECAREVIGHLLDRVGVPVWQFAEEHGLSPDRLQAYLGGELEDLDPKEASRIVEDLAVIARAEAHDYETGVLVNGETAGQIIHRHQQGK